MARPATRSVLVGLRFGVFVWLLSRCPTVPVGCALSVRCSRPRRQLRLLTFLRCHQCVVRMFRCLVLRSLLGVFLVWLVLAVVWVGSFSQYTTAKPSCQVRGVFCCCGSGAVGLVSCYERRVTGSLERVYRAYACASACARVRVRVILTQVSVTPDTADTNTLSQPQKPRPYAPKTGIYIYFYLFLFNGHQRSHRSQKNTIQHMFFFRTSTFFMLSVNNKDYYFYSLSIQEVLTTRPCGYPAGCSRYPVPISVTAPVTAAVTAPCYY